MTTFTRLITILLVIAVGWLLWETGRPQATVEPAPEETPSTTYTSQKDVTIVVDTPLSGATVRSPLTVTGSAPGTWYFEATFPLVVVDWDGRIIGEGYAQAQGEWMTPAMVPFVGTIEFASQEQAAYKRGALILRKDNPSGLSQNDDAVEIPVIF